MTLLQPLIEDIPIERQPEIDAGPIVLINYFTLDRADEDAFLTAWMADAAFMRKQPGLISTQLHRAIGDVPTYLNYAIWETTTQYRAAFTDTEFRATLNNYPASVRAFPHLFQKIAIPGACVA
jgi:heme-degrading monooxygenase HmoA